MADVNGVDGSFKDKPTVPKKTLKDLIPPLRGGNKNASSDTPAEVSAPQVQAAKSNDAAPGFDLAEDIMAQYRNASATKRKAPAPRAATEVLRPGGTQGIKLTCIPFRTNLSVSDRSIITEIVARDIEKLHSGQITDVYS